MYRREHSNYPDGDRDPESNAVECGVEASCVAKPLAAETERRDDDRRCTGKWAEANRAVNGAECQN